MQERLGSWWAGGWGPGCKLTAAEGAGGGYITCVVCDLSNTWKYCTCSSCKYYYCCCSCLAGIVSSCQSQS
jgi:hypothetical protein